MESILEMSWWNCVTLATNLEFTVTIVSAMLLFGKNARHRLPRPRAKTGPNFPFQVSGVRQQTPQRVPLYKHSNASYSPTTGVTYELLGACRCNGCSTFSKHS